MATVALGAVGAALGGAVGGPAGARLGWSIGSLVGGVLFPPKVPTQSRGKLDDVRITGSSYGAAIPQIFGCMRVGGNVIWARDLQEHVTRKSSGGKGIHRPTTKVYTYTLDALVLLCKGPSGQIVKIWADDKVIWDLTAGPPLMPANVEPFLGEETQTPWSVIEAVKGVGNVPAYRGLTCFGIEDFDVGPYGNRPPTFTALVCPLAPPAEVDLWLEFKFPNTGSFLNNTGTQAGYNLSQNDVCEA